MTGRVAIALLAALFAASCTKSKSAGERAETEEPRERSATQMSEDATDREEGCGHLREATAEDLPIELPELESGVLFQTFGSNREYELSGFRVFADGRYERRRRGESWRAMKPLSRESLKELKDAIAAAELPSLAGFHYTDQPPDDATIGVVQVAEGPKGAIVYFNSCPMPALDALFERIGPLILQ